MTTELTFSRTGNRFSASIDGAEAAFVDVDEPSPSSLRIKHTEVAAAEYIRRHPEYLDLVSGKRP